MVVQQQPLMLYSTWLLHGHLKEYHNLLNLCVAWTVKSSLCETVQRIFSLAVPSGNTVACKDDKACCLSTRDMDPNQSLAFCLT